MVVLTILIGLPLVGVKQNSDAFIITLIIFLIIDIIPSLLIYFQYFLHEYSYEIEINTTSDTINIKSKKKSVNYKISEIENLTYYRSYGKGSGWNSFGEYRYFRIEFINHDKLYITCFMIPNIENTLPELLNKSYAKKFKILSFLPFNK